MMNIMKKILLILLISISILGCRKASVYHTYYGDVDIDTVQTTLTKDSLECFPVKEEILDSTFTASVGLRWLQKTVYYVPSKDVYFIRVMGSDGGRSLDFYFTPGTEEEDSIK